MIYKKYQKDRDLLSIKIINEIKNLVGLFDITFIDPVPINYDDDRDMIIGIEDRILVIEFEGDRYYKDIDSSLNIELLLGILYEIENTLSFK